MHTDGRTELAGTAVAAYGALEGVVIGRTMEPGDPRPRQLANGWRTDTPDDISYRLMQRDQALVDALESDASAIGVGGDSEDGWGTGGDTRPGSRLNRDFEDTL